ncbi:MAG: stage III sporulation AC/AD family protein [Oscillospiraceae bacterium]|nr:stage III sporulation AC/AD family protein [Oscillospiraceae bacterium]
MEIVKIASICIVSAVICKIFDSREKEYALYIKIAVSVIILSSVVIYIIPVIESINSIFSRTGTDVEYLKILFKSAGICYVSQFAADVCRDSGDSSLASQAELAGKAALLVIAAPLFEKITEIVISLAGY